MEITKPQKEHIDELMQEAKTALMKAHSKMFEITSYINSFVITE